MGCGGLEGSRGDVKGRVLDGSAVFDAFGLFGILKLNKTYKLVLDVRLCHLRALGMLPVRWLRGPGQHN